MENYITDDISYIIEKVRFTSYFIFENDDMFYEYIKFGSRFDKKSLRENALNFYDDNQPIADRVIFSQGHQQQNTAKLKPLEKLKKLFNIVSTKKRFVYFRLADYSIVIQIEYKYDLPRMKRFLTKKLIYHYCLRTKSLIDFVRT